MRRCFPAVVRQGHSRWMMAVMVAVLLLAGPPLSHAGSQVENARDKMATLKEQAKVVEQKAKAVVERKGVTLMEKVAAYDQVIALCGQVIAIYDSLPSTTGQGATSQEPSKTTATGRGQAASPPAAHGRTPELKQASAKKAITVPPFDSAAVRAMLTRQGFDKSFVDAMVALGEENRRQIATGEISPEYTVRIDEVQPFTEKQRLNQLLDQGALLPKYPRLLPVLSRDNFAEVVQDLCKLDDISVWLRQPNGAPLNEAELAKYRKERASDEQRLLRSPAEFEKKYGAQAVEEWLSLFNRLQPRMVFPARELYRRLLQDCRVLIFYHQVSEKSRAKIASFVGSSLGEILLLTKPESGWALARIKIDTPPDEDIPSKRRLLLPALGQIESSGLCKEGFAEQLAIGQQKGVAQEIDLVLESARLDAKNAQLDAKNAQLDAKNAQLDAKNAQLVAESARSIANIAITNKIAALSNEIEWLVETYAAERSTTLVPLIEERIASIESLKHRLDTPWGTQQNFTGALAQYNVGKLYIGKFRELRGGK